MDSSHLNQNIVRKIEERTRQQDKKIYPKLKIAFNNSLEGLKVVNYLITNFFEEFDTLLRI